MRKIQSLVVASALVIGVGVAIPQSASADPYCYSAGLFSSCVEVPAYTTPIPEPPRPLPVWVCQTIFASSSVMTAINIGTATIWVARIVLIPSLRCVLQGGN